MEPLHLISFIIDEIHRDWLHRFVFQTAHSEPWINNSAKIRKIIAVKVRTTWGQRQQNSDFLKAFNTVTKKFFDKKRALLRDLSLFWPTSLINHDKLYFVIRAARHRVWQFLVRSFLLEKQWSKYDSKCDIN